MKGSEYQAKLDELNKQLTLIKNNTVIDVTFNKQELQDYIRFLSNEIQALFNNDYHKTTSDLVDTAHDVINYNTRINYLVRKKSTLTNMLLKKNIQVQISLGFKKEEDPLHD